MNSLSNALKLIVLATAIFCCTQSSSTHKQGHRFKDLITQALKIDLIKANSETFTAFRKAARLKGYNHAMPIDEFRHICRLEKIYRTSDVIAQHTGFTRSNSSAAMLHYWLATALLTSPNAKVAISRWRRVEREHGIDSSWREAQQIFEQPASHITEMYNDTYKLLTRSEAMLVPDLVRRIYGSQEGSHAWCDSIQSEQKVIASRTMQAVRTNGLTIEINLEKLHLLKESYREATPLIETAKNKRFLTINGLKNSKVALVIHDHFDHYWTFDLLQKNGILDRYTNFLTKIGNMHTTDIFSREGELIASIAYDYRYTQFPYFKHPSYISYDQIETLLTREIHNENHVQALKILEKRKNDADFFKKLPVVVSGIYTELMQQRVKNGVIKTLDRHGKAINVLRPLDPDYLALIVETYDALSNHTSQAINQLKNAQLMLEDFLHKNVTTENPSRTLIMNASSVANFCSARTIIPLHKSMWIEKNLSAISDRAFIS